MTFYLIFSFLVNGTALWIPLATFPTLAECKAQGAYVLAGMQAAYPEDTTMQFLCQDTPHDHY